MAVGADCENDEVEGLGEFFGVISEGFFDWEFCVESRKVCGF